MLRAGFHRGNEAGLLLGLTEENLMRLKDDKPISIPFETCGISLKGRINILYGKTSEDLQQMVKGMGIVGDETHQATDPRVDQEEQARKDHPKILIATVGLPRSGKTTWARAQSYPVVNPDSIRLALHGQRFVGIAEPWVWAMAKTMVRSLFLAGHQTVILDATNTTRKRRDEWQTKEWATFFKVLPASLSLCLDRAADDQEIKPIIEKMAGEFQPLESDERPW